MPQGRSSQRSGETGIDQRQGDDQHGSIVPLFVEKFGRAPLPPSHPHASINDVIAARMAERVWSPAERLMVDKVTAKSEAVRLAPGLRAAPTLATVAMDDVATPAQLLERLRDHVGTDAIAKPAGASGGVVFLRGVIGPDDLAALHALATRDYSSALGERQYAGLPRRVIVEAPIPTADGAPPDDFKFHCVHGEPLLCQIDHARFGASWSRLLRLPDFAPMDPGDGLAMPADVTLPAPDRLAAMIDAARRLAGSFDYVRIDLYDGRDGVYFGEWTFTPSAALGIAPSIEGSHRENPTHRQFSRTLMDALRRRRA